jgi:hypothetical protein
VPIVRPDDTMHTDTARILDVNLNRADEALNG